MVTGSCRGRWVEVLEGRRGEGVPRGGAVPGESVGGAAVGGGGAGALGEALVQGEGRGVEAALPGGGKELGCREARGVGKVDRVPPCTHMQWERFPQEPLLQLKVLAQEIAPLRTALGEAVPEALKAHTPCCAAPLKAALGRGGAAAFKEEGEALVEEVGKTGGRRRKRALEAPLPVGGGLLKVLL